MRNSAANRIAAERAIIRKLAVLLLANGYTVAIQYEDDDPDELEYFGQGEIDKIMARQGACDIEWLRCQIPGVPNSQSSAMFVYGNADDGSEVISDWGERISQFIEPWYLD